LWCQAALDGLPQVRLGKQVAVDLRQEAFAEDFGVGLAMRDGVGQE
jgi:hypothetical protein